MSAARAVQGEWACTLVPNPPAAMLLVQYRDTSPAREVQVLLDGAPAKDDPTVFVDAIVPDVMSLGSELEYHLVLADAEPHFDTLEVRWVDGAGRRRAYTCDAASPTITSLL